MLKVNILFMVKAAKEILGKKDVTILLQENEATIQGVIEKLDREHEGKLSEAMSKPNMSILLNGRDIEFLGGFKTRLHNGDKIVIIPLVAGG